MKLRTLIFWPHLIAGVTAGVVILVMSVTGVVLTYERQMIAWSDSQYRSRSRAQEPSRLPVETLLQTIRAEHPDLAPTAVTDRFGGRCAGHRRPCRSGRCTSMPTRAVCSAKGRRACAGS